MQQTTLSLAKTSEPALSMVLERGHLLRMLDAGPEVQGIWISGPPGSGKTTTIAGYLQARHATALWYQIDSADADASTFFHYLRRTALKNCGGPAARLPELPRHLEDAAGFGRRLFRAIFSCFQRPLIIVFDNHEALPAHSGLHAVLAAAIAEVPRGSRIVIVSRAEPPACLARARMAGTLAVIGAGDLSLREDEYEALARSRNAAAPPELLRQVREASAGWITGAILMLEFARRGGQPQRATAAASGKVLFDYLAEEVFSGFDAATRRFLLNVCWARRVGIRLGAAISAEPRAHLLLANLAHNNYFVSERQGERDCEYILHPLLRDFLQAQARRSMSGREVEEVQQRTADLLVESGHPEEAVELLAANLRWDRMEAVIAAHARLLLQEGRASLLSAWLEELPRDRLQRSAWLLYWYGRACQHRSAREARLCFEMSFSRFAEDPVPDPAGQVAACCGVMESILGEADDLGLLDPWVARLSGLLQLPPSGSAGRGAGAPVMLIALVLRNPGGADFSDWFRRAERELRDAHEDDATLYMRLWLGLAYALTGQFDACSAVLQACAGAAAQTGDARTQCSYWLLAAVNSLLKGDLETADNAADTCLELATAHDAAEAAILAAACRCGAALARGDLHCADAALAQPAAATTRLARFARHYLASWRALVAGSLIEALNEQRKAQACASELGVFFLEVVSSVALAQLLFLCGDARTGAAQLRRVHSIARDVHNPLLEFMTLLIYAEVALREGRSSSGLNALRYALALGRMHGYYHVPWWREQQLGDLLVTALRHRIEVDYVRELVARRRLRPGRAPVDVPAWPWPLTVRSLGGLQLSLPGSEAAGRRRSRPLQVLDVLLALGTRNVEFARVASTLWPHVDSDYAEKSLTINLHRLRRLIGREDFVVLRDGLLSLDEGMVWVDTSALDHVVGQIEACSRPDRGGPQQLDLWREQILDLYRGPFLPDAADRPCITAAREHWRERFARGLDLLAVAVPGGVDPERAVALYESGLERDPCAEVLYRRLMVLYRDQARIAEALETYERCRRAVTGMGRDAPGEDTVQLFRSLQPAAAAAQP